MKHIILISIFFIVGCVPKYETVEYEPSKDAKLAEVKFTALDNYRNADFIEFSLYSRESCEKLPVYNVVGRLSSSQCFFDCSKDVHTFSVNNYLPIGKKINVAIFNKSDSGFIITSCSNLKEYVLKNKKYELEVNNWSTSSSNAGGFGCEFNLYEINNSGEKRMVIPSHPDLLICEDKSEPVPDEVFE